MDYKEIFELIKRKDKKGFEALYVLFADKFYGYAVNKWHFSEDDAMNIVYQTLETLVLKITNYEFESKTHFDNFIYKVFINFLRQQFRQNRRKNQEISFISLSDVEFGKEDDLEWLNNDNLDNTFSNKAFSDYYQTPNNENPKLVALQNALKKLEKFDKDILLLRAQNFTYEEIAKMLGVENNQLKVKHHRAKNRLLKILQKELI